MKISAQN